MANEHEILLQSRLSKVSGSDKKLLDDLDKLSGKYKLEVGLKLSKNALKDLKVDIDVNTSNLTKAQSNITKFKSDMESKLSNIKLRTLSEQDLGVLNKFENKISEISKQTENAGQKMSLLRKTFTDISDTINRGKALDVNVTKNTNIQELQGELNKLYDGKVIVKSISDEVSKGGNIWKLFNAEVENSNGTFTKLKGSINGSSNEVRVLETELQKTSRATQSLGDMAIRTIGYFLSFQTVISLLRNALSVMRDVDSEMVIIQKVSGRTADEMKRLAQESYSVGSEFGRSADQYLKAVSEFSSAGYGKLADDLGRLALLTQNAGDVNADTANKFLLSADSAWKLNGNITELTKIIDGMNEVSNNNATTVQKMAEGIEVAGSVFANAGLSVQDYTAIIGTATSATQLSGNEMARAWRTILMTMRQIKGTDDSGGIIDEAEFKKAGQAIENLGVKMTYLDNGVQKLRPTMEILNDVAAVWKKLSDEGRNIKIAELQEALGGKLQANALTAVLDNWEKVSKMQAEYFNSSGSAMRENEVYMNSWQAKSEQLKNSWVEFVAKSTEVEWIKGTLESVTFLVKSFDNLGTVLLLVGAWFVVFKFQSIISGFKSIGDSVKALGGGFKGLIAFVQNYSAASQYAKANNVSLSASYQALGVSANMAQLAIGGLMAAITIGVMIWNNYKQAQEENIRATNEKAQKLKEESNTVSDLTEKYKKLKSSEKQDEGTRTEIKGIQDQITKLVGKQAENLDLVNGKLDTELSKLREIDLQTAKNAKASLESAKIIAEDQAAKGMYAKDAPSMFPVVSFGASPVEKALMDTGLNEKYPWGGDMLPTIHLIGKSAQEIIPILTEWRDAFNTLGADGADALGYVNKALTFYEEKVKNAEQAQKDFFEVSARVDVLESLKSVTVNSQETFDTYVEGIRNSTEYSEDYKKVLIEVAGTIFPQFASAVDETGNKISSATNKVAEFSEALKRVKDSADLVNKLQKEGVTPDNLESIISKYSDLGDEVADYCAGLITEKQLIELIKGKHKEDEEAFKLSIQEKLLASETFYDELQKNNSSLIKELADYYGLDIENYATAEELKNAISAQVANDINNITGQTIIELANKYGVDTTNYSNALSQQLLIKGVTESQIQSMTADGIKALAEQYGIDVANFAEAEALKAEIKAKAEEKATSDAERIRGLAGGYVSKSPTTKKISSGGSGTGSKSGSKSDDPWKKAFDEEYDYLKYKRDLDLIDNKTYYEELDRLNRQYFANREKYIKEYRKYEIELYKLQQTISKDNLSYSQRKIDIFSSQDDLRGTHDNADAIVDIYREMQENVHQQAEWYRSRGLSDEHEYIQELKKQWTEYEGRIQSVYKSVVDDRLALSRKYIEDRKFYDDWGTDNEIAAHERILAWLRTEFLETGKLTWDQYWQYAEQVTKDHTTSIRDHVEKLNQELTDKMSNSKDYVTSRTYFDDWAGNDDSAIAARRRIVEREKQFQAEILDNAELTNEQREKLLKESNERINDFDDNYMNAKLQRGYQWIDRQKHYGKMSFDEERAAYARLLQALEAYYAERGSYDIEYYEKLEELKQKNYDLDLRELEAKKSTLSEIIELTKKLIQQETNDKINALKDENKLLEERKKLLKEEYDAYGKIIDARKKLLDKEQDDRSYAQDLTEKQKEIQKIQDRLSELQFNDSAEARKEKAEKAEELAKLQLDLDNFIYNNDIKNQKNALDNELERYKEATDSKIEGIDKEKQANDDAAEALRKSIENNGELVRLAMERIDKEGDKLYGKLLEYNRIYGTGIDEDIKGSWEDYLRIVDRGNKTTLEYTRGIYQDILDLTRQISKAQAEMTLQGDYESGVRSYFENQGYSVLWDGDKGQFHIGNNGMEWVTGNASDYENIDGRLQATYEQLLDLEKQLANLPKYDTGGYIRKDQLAIVHKGERILNPEETKAYDLSKPILSKINLFEAIKANGIDIWKNSMLNQSDFMKNNIPNNLVSSVNNKPVTVEVQQTFNGVTSENLLKELPKTMKNVAGDMVDGYNSERVKSARTVGTNKKFSRF